MFYNDKYTQLNDDELNNLCIRLQLNDKPVLNKRKISPENSDNSTTSNNDNNHKLSFKVKFEPPNNDENNDTLLFSIRTLKS
jgi:hypothetical protein